MCTYRPTELYKLQVGAPDGGRYRVALDSDAVDFGGSGRVGHGVDHFTEPEGVPGMLSAAHIRFESQCTIIAEGCGTDVVRFGHKPKHTQVQTQVPS